MEQFDWLAIANVKYPMGAAAVEGSGAKGLKFGSELLAYRNKAAPLDYVIYIRKILFIFP